MPNVLASQIVDPLQLHGFIKELQTETATLMSPTKFRLYSLKGGCVPHRFHYRLSAAGGNTHTRILLRFAFTVSIPNVDTTKTPYVREANCFWSFSDLSLSILLQTDLGDPTYAPLAIGWWPLVDFSLISPTPSSEERLYNDYLKSLNMDYYDGIIGKQNTGTPSREAARCLLYRTDALTETPKDFGGVATAPLAETDSGIRLGLNVTQLVSITPGKSYYAVLKLPSVVEPLIPIV